MPLSVKGYSQIRCENPSLSNPPTDVPSPHSVDNHKEDIFMWLSRVGHGPSQIYPKVIYLDNLKEVCGNLMIRNQHILSAITTNQFIFITLYYEYHLSTNCL